VPGVVSSGLGTDLPWSGWDENSSWGLPDGKSEPHSGRFHMASPGYFETIGTRLVAGRYFDEREYRKQPDSIIVNEALVNRYLDGKGALGRKLSVWGKPREIVGIVADIRDYPADNTTAPAYWFPDGQVPFGQLSVVVKANGSELSAVKQAIARIDPELPMANVRSLEEHAARAMAARRFALWLFQAFTVLALVLAAVGVYGLLSYSVQQRAREIGIRMALGATRSNVWNMVVRDGVRVAALGALAGAVTVPMASRWISGFLFGVSPVDTAILLLAPAVLVGTAFLATLAPARQATRCEPADALRHQ